jgi:hypothetical protein
MIMSKKYGINLGTIRTVKAARKLDKVQFMEVLLPGANQKIAVGDHTLYLGSATKISSTGELLKVPLLFTCEEEYEINTIIVAATQFERAMEIVSLIDEEQSYMLMDEEHQTLTICCGESRYDMPYYTADSGIKLATPAHLDGKPVMTLEMETAALQRRIATVRPFVKNCLEFRGCADGQIKIFGEANATRIPYSVMEPCECKASYDASVLENAKNAYLSDVEARKTDTKSAPLDPEITEKALYGNSVLVNARYIPFFMDNIYGKVSRITFYKNGFLFESNETELIGLAGETASVQRPNELMFANITTNSAAYDYVAVCDDVEVKKLIALLNLWEQGIKEKVGKEATTNLPHLKITFTGKKMKVSITEAQTYIVQAEVFEPKAETHKKESMDFYFRKEVFSKVIGALNDEKLYLCFASGSGQSVFYVRDGHMEEGKPHFSGSHIFVHGAKKASYDAMCAAVTKKSE